MKILIAGDYCPQNRIASLIKNKDYSFFDDLRAYTKKVDYSILNLECPIMNGCEKPIVKSGPNLCTDKNVINTLRYGNINCVTLANNHILDYGARALQNTKKELMESGIDYVGVGENLNTAQTILYKDIKGKRLAVINCCEHESSIAIVTTPGANPLHPINQYYAIQEARNKADYVIVIIHGGPEHYQLPTPRMQTTYRFFIDAGADVIINHHQHCYSGYEMYKGKPIFYGLGNLCFDRIDKKNANWNYGHFIILDLAESINFELVPYEQCNDKPTISILKNVDMYRKQIFDINAIIADAKLLHQRYEQFLVADKRKYQCIIEPYTSRIAKYLFRKHLLPTWMKRKYVILQNVIQCESHQDRLIAALNYEKSN